MRGLLVVAGFLFSTLGCQRTEDKSKTLTTATGSGSGSGSAAPVRAKSEQLAPPLDLKNPPMDAVKTASGLIYKKLTSVPGGTAAKRNDTVMINYTGWRQVTGETFYTNRDRGQPMPLPLANTAPGFTEAMQLLKKGERAMLWLPPSIGYKGAPPPGSAPETLVYEVEVVEIIAAPAVPPDVGVPPQAAQALKSGIKYVVVQPGTGKDKARFFDTVTFNYSAWDKDGRMFDTTELRKRPATVPPFRQTAAMEEILTSMTAGQRARYWLPAERMQQDGRPLPGMPEGVLTYEVELLTIEKGKEPPRVPVDVAAPPADARKTPKGVSYKVLSSRGGGPKPKVSDVVRVNYTGWTTDGRMFDSSVIKGEPAEFSLGGVIVGWTDGIPVMSVGDKVRFWIPDELAYKGSPGKPQGMLVFDVELLEIKAAPPVEAADGHGHGGGAAETQPAPPDVAAPPAGAKQSPRGVSYKILKAVKGAAHPVASDRVKVHYTGWTTDGKMFDTSRKGAQQPIEFSLGGVIPGWTDGIPMVGVGEQARLWIPQELAYPGGGGPQGMLVFDVELLEIKKQ